MEDNPFKSTGSNRQGESLPSEGASPKTERLGCLTSAMLGALAAIVGAFPVASLVGFFYRFPIPFSGYASGFKAIIPALFAILLYGAIGGFLVVAVLGALAGLLARQVASLSGLTRTRSMYLMLCLAVLADLPPVLLLAVLDKIIGPW